MLNSFQKFGKIGILEKIFRINAAWGVPIQGKQIPHNFMHSPNLQKIIHIFLNFEWGYRYAHNCLNANQLTVVTKLSYPIIIFVNNWSSSKIANVNYCSAVLTILNPHIEN